MISHRSIGTSLLLAALAACAKPAAAPPTLDAAAMKAAIEKQEAGFDALFKSKDANALAAMYAEDATWILPDGGVYHGRAAITEAAKGFFASYDSLLSQPAVTDAFFPVDSMNAVQFAHMPFTMWAKGAKMGEAHVNYFATHWQKGTDGVWRAHHDLNVDQMEKTAAPKK